MLYGSLDLSRKVIVHMLANITVDGLSGRRGIPRFG